LIGTLSVELLNNRALIYVPNSYVKVVNVRNQKSDIFNEELKPKCDTLVKEFTRNNSLIMINNTKITVQQSL
jgi:hypothetical protein